MLLDPTTLMAYVLASLALLVVPGPSVLYIVALSARHGRKAGLVSVVGVGAGAYVHFAAAALGLGAIMAASATAFGVVKWLGVGYLAFLGFRTWLDRDADVVPTVQRPQRALLQVAAQGALVTILNPKLALFVVAFVPQFIDPSRDLVAAQALSLGAIVVGMAAVTDTVYAV